VSAPLTRSELAALTGVSPDTLRHYERKGVLPPPPRSANNYRRYPADAVRRVQLIRRAMTIGFTLDELSRVLREREAGGTPCRRVRALVAARLVNLEGRLEQLMALRHELQLLLEDWDARLESVGPGRPARLLEELAARPGLDRKGGGVRGS
jgi:MerR family copper efflux transcriptional regulator